MIDLAQLGEIFQTYIIGKALVMIPVLNVLGYLVKRTPKIPDWAIDYILLVGGLTGAIALMGFNVDAIIQGFLVAGAAIGGHQFKKQTTEGLEVSKVISSMSQTESDGKGE